MSDISEWQRQIEARLEELEKKKTEEECCLKSIFLLQQLAIHTAESCAKNIEDIKILRELVKKGKI